SGHPRVPRCYRPVSWRVRAISQSGEGAPRMRAQTPHLSTADLMARIGDQTVASMFVERVGASGDRVALRWRDGDGWASITYRQYGDAVAHVAGGLRGPGVQRGDRV